MSRLPPWRAAVAIALQLTFIAPAPASAADPLRSAALEAQQGRLADALRDADTAVRLAPALEKAHLLRGFILARLGRNDEARAESMLATRLDPRDEQAWLLLGNVELIAKRFAGARAAFERAMALAPSDARPVLGAATAARGLRDAPSQLRLFRTLARLRPNDVEPMLWEGDLQRSVGRLDLAEAAYQRAYQAHRADPRVTLDLAELYRTEAKFWEAELAYRASLHAKQSTAAELGLGLALLGQEGREAAAVAPLRDVARAQPGNTGARFALIVAQTRAGLLVDALAGVQAWLALPAAASDPNREQASQLKPYLEFATGASQTAVRDAADLSDRGANNVERARLYAGLAENAGDHVASIRALRRLHAIAPDDVPIAVRLAKTLALDAPQEAQALLEAAAARKPNSSEVLGALEHSYESAHDPRAAAAAAAWASSSDSAEAFDALQRVDPGRYQAQLESIATDHPAFAVPRTRLAEAALARADVAAAVRYAREAVAAGASDYRARDVLASILERSGHADQAESERREAVRLAIAEQDRATKRLLDLVSARGGTLDLQTLLEYSKTGRDNPNAGKEMLDRWLALREQLKLPAAQTIEQLRSFVPLETRGTSVLAALARFEQNAGQTDLAAADWRAALERSPNDPALWRSLAALYAEHGSPDDAVRAYRHVLTLDAKDAAARAYLAQHAALAGGGVQNLR